MQKRMKHLWRACFGSHLKLQKANNNLLFSHKSDQNCWVWTKSTTNYALFSRFFFFFFAMPWVKCQDQSVIGWCSSRKRSCHDESQRLQFAAGSLGLVMDMPIRIVQKKRPNSVCLSSSPFFYRGSQILV